MVLKKYLAESLGEYVMESKLDINDVLRLMRGHRQTENKDAMLMFRKVEDHAWDDRDLCMAALIYFSIEIDDDTINDVSRIFNPRVVDIIEELKSTEGLFKRPRKLEKVIDDLMPGTLIVKLAEIIIALEHVGRYGHKFYGIKPGEIKDVGRSLELLDLAMKHRGGMMEKYPRYHFMIREAFTILKKLIRFAR